MVSSRNFESKAELTYAFIEYIIRTKLFDPLQHKLVLLVQKFTEVSQDITGEFEEGHRM